jgi:hypothetical protein
LPEGCTRTDVGELPAGNGDPTIAVNWASALLLVLLPLVLMRKAATAFEFGSDT